MADNVTVPPSGTGDATPIIATDQIGSVHHQLVKIEYGVADSATPVSTTNPLPVTLANTGANATAVKVDGSAVTQPVSAASLPLPTGAASAANQTTEIASLASLDTKTPALGAATAANSSPVTLATDGQFVASTGSLTETAPATDTASSGLNGRLQRIAQRLTSLIALLPTSVGQKARSASLAVTLSSEDVAALAPPAAISGYATEATLDTRTGSLTETAPATDTASSGHNGRLQRIAQRLTSLIALLPTTLSSNNLRVSLQESGITLAVDSELPAAAALADAASNPSTPLVGASLLGYNGATWDRLRVATIQKDLATVTITSITTVWTPASSKKFRLMGGSISVSAAGSVLFEDNAAAATVFRTPKLLADTPYNFVVLGGQGFLSAAANNVLKGTLSVAGSVVGNLWGVEE